MRPQFMTATEQPEWVTEKVSLPTLTAMVVGLMIGSGGFLLPRGFGVLGAIVALTIAGTGMLMLAFVFQRLAMRKPDPAIGYWASACAGNTSYWVLIMTTLSAVVPGFGTGETLLAIVVSAIGVWLFVFVVLRGVRGAGVTNYVVPSPKTVRDSVFRAVWFLRCSRARVV